MTSSGTSGFSEVYSVTSASLLAAVLLTDIWREERWCTESSTATGGSRDTADDVTGNGTDDDPRGSAVTSHFYVSGKKMPATAQGGGRPTNAAAQLKLLATAGACFGVAFSCHHISAVLVVPALCWLAAADARSISDGFWSMMVPALAALVRVHMHLHLHVNVHVRARVCACVRVRVHAQMRGCGSGAELQEPPPLCRVIIAFSLGTFWILSTPHLLPRLPPHPPPPPVV